MPDDRPDQPKIPPSDTSKPAEPPYPEWPKIRARITPGMLGPQPAPEATDWCEVISDEDEPR